MADSPQFEFPGEPGDSVVWMNGFTGWGNPTWDYVPGSGNNPENVAAVVAYNITQSTATYYDADDGSILTFVYPENFLKVVDGGMVASVDMDDVGGAKDLSTITAGHTSGLHYNAADLFVHDADGIVYSVSGTDPAGTAGVPTSGYRLNYGAAFKLESADEIDNFRFFNLGPNPTTDLGVYVVLYTYDELQSGGNIKGMQSPTN